MADLLYDVRHAVRLLRRSPSFTLVAVLTLALGIGATTATYSVFDTILLRPLPFADGDRLVRVVENAPPFAPGRPLVQRGINHQEFLDWRTRARTLSDAAAVIAMAQRIVPTPDGAAGLWGAMASPNLFAMLGTHAMLGRTLGVEDQANPDIVVLSFATWRRHFRGDAAIIGKTIELRAGALMPPMAPRQLMVVGVLPADFEFPLETLDFFTPIALNPSRPPPGVTTIARLAPGVSLDAALQEVNAMGAAVRPPWPANAPPLTSARFELQPLKQQMVRNVQPALRVLVAAVAVVLLIVCANVANLLLARATVRQREVAMRLAVGASRWRIVRQILVECAILAGAGGVIGALVAAGGIALVKQLGIVDAPGIFRFTFASALLPRAHELAVDLRVLGIALALAGATALVCSVLPALHAARTSHLSVMAAPGKASARGGSRARGVLVVAQLVMATMLLVAAGLLTHSFINLSRVNKGYDASNVVAFQLLFPDQYSMARKAETIHTLLGRFRAAREVRSAGFARHGLLIGEELTLGVFVPAGRSLDDVRNERPRVRSVSDGFLTAMGVSVREGRDFTAADDASAPLALVMNESAARRYFGEQRAVGQVVDWHLAKQPTQATVVGVFADLRQESVTDEVHPEVFVHYAQFMSLLERLNDLAARQNEWAIGFLSFALRTTGDPAAALPVIRQTVRSVDPSIGIDAMAPMDDLVGRSMARERFYAVLLAIFAVIAAILAAVGVYGVLAYAVTQRTREIGIRMALGAEQSQVLALVLRRGVLLMVVGIGLGLVAAAATGRWLEHMLFGLRPLDPTTFAAASFAFAAVAALACYVPARRATKVDPVRALRVDA